VVLVGQAAQGELRHNDDTPMKILAYLNELQRHAAEVGQDPAAWMPSNYCLTLESSSGKA
jgi:hypothetical protein